MHVCVCLLFGSFFTFVLLQVNFLFLCYDLIRFCLFLIVLHAVEFQKRGLPHAHIIVWLSGHTSEPTPALIDSFISAEIPDPENDLLGYVLVSEHMIHGPCGVLNDRCPCMKNGSCSKFYPKSFQDETYIDKDGFAIYRRPDNGRFILKGNVRLDNRWVVPYNMFLLKKYGAHINVEWCNKTNVLKYLFKYVTKGQDCAKFYLTKLAKGQDTSFDCSTSTVNEVKEYLDCRYICEQDAVWRILGFDIHRHFPAIERLVVHLPNMNSIHIHPNANLARVVSNSFVRRTTLTEWFVTNRTHPEARDLTYCDFPRRWCWDDSTRSWKKRLSGTKIGRLYFVHPSAGERYFLRMLLMVVKGAQSYEGIRTFQCVVYDTFKATCAARGLLGDDSEWHNGFREASTWATPYQLRHLFVTMLIYCDINDERAFFESFLTELADDFQYHLRRSMHDLSYVVPPTELKDHLLDELSSLFAKRGSKISEFNLPTRSSNSDSISVRTVMDDEMSYDIDSLIIESNNLCSILNSDQKKKLLIV